VSSTHPHETLSSLDVAVGEAAGLLGPSAVDTTAAPRILYNLERARGTWRIRRKEAEGVF
jgi:hypothetical protein